MPNLLETFQNATAADVDITSRPSDSGHNWIELLVGSEAFVHPDDYGYVPSVNNSYHVFDTALGEHDADIIYEGVWLSGPGVETYFPFLATDDQNFMQIRLLATGVMRLLSVTSGGLGTQVGSDFDYGAPGLGHRLKILLEIRGEFIFLYFDVDTVGDGSGYSGFSGTPDHTWNSTVIGDGTHPGQLVGWGSDAVSKFGFLQIDAQPLVVVGAPVADFDFLADGLDVSFFDRSTDEAPGTVSEWLWDFGDGSPNGTTQNPTHTYAAPGTYTVGLIVTDDEANDSTVLQRTVRVWTRAADPFQEVDGTDLHLKTVLDGGHAWNVRSGSMEVQGGAAVPVGAAPGDPDWVATLNFGYSVVSISAMVQGSAGKFGLIFRLDEATGEMLGWVVDPVAGEAWFAIFDGVSWTLGGSGAPWAVTAKATPYHLEVRALPDTGGSEFYVDGDLVASASNISTGLTNHHGIWTDDLSTEFLNVDIANHRVLDYFPVGGQSNAVGSAPLGTSPVVVKGAGFKTTGGSVPGRLSDPVIETGGSAWPQFGITWMERTGRTALIGNAAVKGSAQHADADGEFGHWDDGGTLYDAYVDEFWLSVRAAQNNGYALQYICMPWDQGGRDAQKIDDAIITKAQYKSAALNMLAKFRLEDFGPDFLMLMSRLGRPSISGDTAGWQDVRAAQDELVASEADVILGWGDAATMDSSLYDDDFHYTQEGYNLMGSSLAESMADELYGAAANEPPVAVDDLSAGSLSGGRILLSWSAVEGATGYRVYRGNVTGVTSGTGTLVDDIPSPGLIDDVGGEVERFYVVVAYNAVGDAADSNEASAIGGGVSVGGGILDIAGIKELTKITG